MWHGLPLASFGISGSFSLVSSLVLFPQDVSSLASRAPRAQPGDFLLHTCLKWIHIHGPSSLCYTDYAKTCWVSKPLPSSRASFSIFHGTRLPTCLRGTWDSQMPPNPTPLGLATSSLVLFFCLAAFPLAFHIVASNAFFLSAMKAAHKFYFLPPFISIFKQPPRPEPLWNSFSLFLTITTSFQFHLIFLTGFLPGVCASHFILMLICAPRSCPIISLSAS